VHGERLVGEAYPPPDPEFKNLSAGFASPQGWFGQGCRDRVSLALPPPPSRGGSHPRQRPLAGRSPRPENVWARLSAFRTQLQLCPQLDRQGRIRTQRHAANGLHHAHPHGAGRNLRGIRLPRRRPGRPQSQPLDHAHPSAQSLQQRLHDGAFQSLRQAHHKGSRRRSRETNCPSLYLDIWPETSAGGNQGSLGLSSGTWSSGPLPHPLQRQRIPFPAM
ncbi:uncharacterized protein METZ01_LOCUS359079, partial [marine metagenome]